MHRFFEIFGSRKGSSWNKRVFLVVIHLTLTDAFENALADTLMAAGNRADGVMLIDMNGRLIGDQLVATADAVAAAVPGFFVGINDLDDWDPADTIRRIQGTRISGVWSDRAGNREAVLSAKRDTDWKGILFGGVVFKYQADYKTPDEELPEVIGNALPYVDVLTTTGVGTGHAIEIERLKRYRQVAGPEAIVAVASGGDKQNAPLILPYANAILAASSLVGRDDRPVPEEVLQMGTVIENWRPE